VYFHDYHVFNNLLLVGDISEDSYFIKKFCVSNLFRFFYFNQMISQLYKGAVVVMIVW